MNWLLNATLFFAAFVGMEWVANVMHKHVMHGWLWCLHASHHEPRTGTFEKNDLFACFFAVPSIALIYTGTHYYAPVLWLGLGMTAYGAAYFIFHDVIVHRRIRMKHRPRGRYMTRIIQAHGMHHAHHEKHGAISFGFLYSPPIEKLKATR